MKINDTVHLALRNLRQARLRTALTTLGVSIGIASLAGMVSLGIGLQEQFVSQFTNAGLFDVVTVTSARTPIVGVRFGRGGPGRGPVPFGRRGGAAPQGDATETNEPPLPALDDAAIARLAEIPNVRDVYPNLRLPARLTFDGATEIGSIVGVPMSTRDHGAFQKMRFGSFFATDADRACIVSLDLAVRMVGGDGAALVGRDLTYASPTRLSPGDVPTTSPSGVPSREKLIPVNCRVVGVVERDPAPGGGVQTLVAGVIIPMSQAREIDAKSVTSAASNPGTNSRGAGFQAVTVKVARSQFTQDVQAAVRALGYQAFSLNDALEGAKRVFIILDIVLSLIGSIALAVSCLGIVNTMVMSILERTREIGVMKAIGGSDADVRGIFLIEASLIGLIGGTVGVALGWLVTRAINIGANIYIEGQGGTAATLFSFPWWLVAGAVGFSVAVSLVAGSYPASRAARLNPIQALRHD